MKERLPAKWRPTQDSPTKDNLDHTPNRKKANQAALEKYEIVTLNPDVTEKEHPSNLTRLFTLKTVPQTPTRREQKDPNQNRTSITVTIGNKSRREKTAIAATTENGDTLFKGTITQNQEYPLKQCLLTTLIKTREIDNITIRTKSKQLTKQIAIKAIEAENTDWFEIPDKSVTEQILFLVRTRSGTVKIEYIKDYHKDAEYAKATRILAEIISDRTQNDLENTEQKVEVPEKWKPNGVKLSGLTTKQIYRMLVARDNNIPRQTEHHKRIREQAIEAVTRN